jgi:hypothetical protein
MKSQVTEIELSAPEPEKHSPLVEVPFNENVIGCVSDLHMARRNECRFDPHCAWCNQTGRSAMELRHYSELDALAEAKLRALVRKGHKEACLFWAQRADRNRTLWSRVRTLLGV